MSEFAVLTNKQVVRLHDLMLKLYEKYPRYVHFDICYSTEDACGTTLSPTKKMKLNIYTPLLHHNNYDNFKDFETFIEKVLADGIANFRIKVLEDEIANATNTKANQNEIIERAKKELAELRKRV